MTTRNLCRCFPIEIASNDSFFAEFGRTCLDFTRSDVHCRQGWAFVLLFNFSLCVAFKWTAEHRCPTKIENRSCRSCLIGLSLSQIWFLGRTVQQTNCLHWCVCRLRMPWGWHDLQSSNEFIIFKNKLIFHSSNDICSGNRVKTTRWKWSARRAPCFQLAASELLAEQLRPEVEARGDGQAHRLRGRRREGGDPGQPHLDPGEDNLLLLKFANCTFQNLFFNEHNRIASHLFSALKVISPHQLWAKIFTSATYSGKARWPGSWRKSLSGWPVFLFGSILLCVPTMNFQDM